MQKSKTTLIWSSLISLSIATVGCTGNSNIGHTHNDDSNSITHHKKIIKTQENLAILELTLSIIH